MTVKLSVCGSFLHIRKCSAVVMAEWRHGTTCTRVSEARETDASQLHQSFWCELVEPPNSEFSGVRAAVIDSLEKQVKAPGAFDQGQTCQVCVCLSVCLVWGMLVTWLISLALYNTVCLCNKNLILVLLTLGLVLFSQSLFSQVALHHLWVGHTKQRLFLHRPHLMLLICRLIIRKHIMFYGRREILLITVHS